MKAGLGLHELVGFSHHGERRLQERCAERFQHPCILPAQVAIAELTAAVARAGVVRVLDHQIVERFAVAQLLQRFLRALPRLFHGGIVQAQGLEEDVEDQHHVRLYELLDVQVVERLEILLRR